MAKLLAALAMLLTLHMATSSKLVCHMTNWAQYRPSSAKFTPDNIDPFLCTHLIYTMATINSFNHISAVEWNDETHYARLNALKSVNPALQTLLSVGGTTNGISPFIAMVAKAESREVFIKSAISFLRTHNFDGLNLAWEYPGTNGSPEDDRVRFTLLVTELSAAFEEEARNSRKPLLLLSASVAALRPAIDGAYEVNKIAAHLDFINVMTYDLHGHWEETTGHHSPLYASDLDSHMYHDINSSVGHWLELGAPAEKLLLGFPTYGRTYHLTSAAAGLGAPSKGPAEAGPYTRTAGFWAFYEVCDFISSAEVEWIPAQQVPYATFGSAWVGYDDRQSYSFKVMWLTNRNLGGAHVWTMDMDDFTGSFCSLGPYPLINHLRTSMGFPPKPSTTTAPPTTKDPIASFCQGRPDGLYENVADQSTYFQCFRGNTYLHRCQPGLIFWDSCKCCEWP